MEVVCGLEQASAFDLKNVPNALGPAQPSPNLLRTESLCHTSRRFSSIKILLSAASCRS